MIESLPDDLLLHKGSSVFDFLSVNDLTNLASTCHFMTLKIDKYRGPLPYIFRQKLLTKNIGYFHMNLDGDFRHDDDPRFRFHVVQSQASQLLLKTERHGIVQVKIRFSNALWNECYEPELRRPGRFGMSHIFDPDGGFITCAIHHAKYEDGSIRRTKLFHLKKERDDKKERYGLTTLDKQFEVLRTQDENHPLLNVNPYDLDHIRKLPAGKRIEKDLRDCMRYYWMSAMQAIATAPKFCPSIQRCMRFSERFKNFECSFYETKRLEEKHKMCALYRWRKPSSSSDWLSIVPYPDGDSSRKYEIHEIPWFRDWYPKPTIIDRKNLLASLPVPTIITHFLPHLSLADFTNLSEALPAFTAQLLPHLSLAGLTSLSADCPALTARAVYSHANQQT